MSNDFHAAIKLFSESLDFKPNDAMCWSFRANCHKRLKNYEDALNDSLKSIELNPKVHDLTYLRVVKCYLLFGDVDEAKKYVDLSKKYFPKKVHVDEQLKIVEKLELLEAKANEDYIKKDYIECLHSLDQALEIAQECSRLKQLKNSCLSHLQLKMLSESDTSTDDHSVMSVFSTTDIIGTLDMQFCKGLQSDDSLTESESGKIGVKRSLQPGKRLLYQEPDEFNSDSEESMSKKIKKFDGIETSKEKPNDVNEKAESVKFENIANLNIVKNDEMKMGPPTTNYLPKKKTTKRLTRKRCCNEESDETSEDEEKPKGKRVKKIARKNTSSSLH